MRYCLFPFFDQYQLLVNRKLANGSIDCVIPLKSWRDSIVSNQGRLNGVQILPLDETAIQHYDAIIILPASFKDITAVVSEFIQTNLKNNKKVIFSYACSCDHLCPENELFTLTEGSVCSQTTCLSLKDQKLNPIKASVIYNTSIIGGDYHTDLDFYLAGRLKAVGAHTCVISASPLAVHYGFVPFPIEQLDRIGVADSAKWFNQFIHELDDIRNPDVFIISMPEQLLSYYSNSGEIGVGNYICTNSVLPDYTIVNFALDNYTDDILNDNILLAKERVSCGIDAIVLSDVMFDSVSYSDDVMPSHKFFRGDALEHAYICDRLNKSSRVKGYVYNNQKAEDLDKLFENIMLKITRGNNYFNYERML